MAIEVRKVTGDRRGMKAFKRLPWSIYKDDPAWAPDLIMDLDARLDMKKHPFWEFATGDYFLAYKDGAVAGRICAFSNPNHEAYHKENIGFWGFFESIDDQPVANALFDAAKAWNKEHGHPAMRGPMSCDNQDEVGMLYEGFEFPRYFIMPHNPPYYMKLCENYGMSKAKDLIAFRLDLTQPIPERESRLAEMAQARMEKRGFIFRHLNKKAVVEDFEKCMQIYHEGWKDNWGFVPTTRKQFVTAAENLKIVAEEGLVTIIEGPADPATGKRPPVAMAVSLYDYMECTLWARKFPYCLQFVMQLLNLAWRLWVKPMPKFRRGRLFLAGVMPEYRGQGMDALLYVLPFQAGKKHGALEAELSWELEDNIAIISPITKIGGKVYKKMRIWDCAL
jgi:hypothetical protein